MALRPKDLAQGSAAAGIGLALYTVPTGQSILAKLHVVNRGNSTDTLRVSKRVAGAAEDVSQFRAYDEPLAARDSRTWSIIAEATDVIYVQSSTGNASWTLEGLLRS